MVRVDVDSKIEKHMWNVITHTATEENIPGKKKAVKINVDTHRLRLFELAMLSFWPASTANADVIVHPMKIGHIIQFNGKRVEMMFSKYNFN